MSFSQFCDIIILVSALCIAITNIYNFFAKPTSKLKKKKIEELNNQISDILDKNAFDLMTKNPKTISKDSEIGKNYEFTFNTYKEYVSATPAEIFDKSELINIEYSDKVGIEQKNEFNCK